MEKARAAYFDAGVNPAIEREMSETTSSPAPEPPRSLLFRLVVGSVLALVRAVYKVKAIHPERVPAGGGVLMLSNHVSYMDALILGAACPRPLRFVMWDALYQVWWMNGFLRYVGTVPISATRAKDAVRTVATALKEGGLVCLFPEGEITRHGMVNELRKGFELMARQGEAKVLPVWLDGLYGSIFSFQGGHFFKKRPKQVRYPATVYFGEPLEAKAGNAAAVRRVMLSMSEQALMAREAWKLAGEDRTAFVNALRLREAEWHRPGDVLLCLEPAGSILYRTVHELARLLPGTKIIESMALAAGAPVVAFGGLASVSQAGKGERLLFCFDADAAQIMALQASPVLRGYFDAASGLLISSEVPNPPAAEGEEGQHGTRDGTLGRLLPGLALESLPAGLTVDEDGFVLLTAAS
jgi:acyl-[acyl-carrier-protein]-phospholipid O-acyltransferase/long-chain-fatty-acid--[acyl-carrier-protein] ligase